MEINIEEFLKQKLDLMKNRKDDRELDDIVKDIITTLRSENKRLEGVHDSLLREKRHLEAENTFIDIINGK